MDYQGHTSSGAEHFRQLVAAGLTDDVDQIDTWQESSLWFVRPEKRISGYPPADRKLDFQEDRIPEGGG